MGFSVSGTYVLLFFGVLFAMGTLHTAAGNAVEEVREAQQSQNDHLLAIQETEVEIDDVSLVDGATCHVNVTANNTGSTRLSVADTDVFADGVYEDDVSTAAEVADDPDTDLWLPGQQLAVDLGERDGAPDRVKVVSGPGIADAQEVTGLSC